MKKNPLLQCLGSGLTIGAVIGVGLFLFNSPDSFTFRERMMSLLAAAIVGVLSGVFLGFLFFFVERIRASRFNALREKLSADGPILVEEKCSRYVDGRRCPGRLFLTEKTLTFRTSRESEGGFSFDRDAVSSVQIVDPRRCVILLTSSDGKEELLSVVDPRMWFDLLGTSDSESKKEETEHHDVSE